MHVIIDTMQEWIDILALRENGKVSKNGSCSVEDIQTRETD